MRRRLTLVQIREDRPNVLHPGGLRLVRANGAEDVNCFVICEQSHLERVAHREQVVPGDSKAMRGALIGDALDDVVGYACTL
jgi:hypothetical protein